MSSNSANLSKTWASTTHRAACLTKEAQATTVFAIQKADLCVRPFLGKDVVFPLNKWEVRLHVAQGGVALDLALTSWWETTKSLLQT